MLDNDLETTVVEPVAPSSETDRIETLDLLRGVGVLGILLMNIYAFSLHGAAYFNPMVDGGDAGAGLAVWIFTHIFADAKFYSIFSLLFGAGIVLFTQRLEAREVRPRGLHYRRMVWLLIIGALHGIFLWFGDILLTYAWCGMWLYPLRHKSARTLTTVGVLFLAFAILLSCGFGLFLGYARSQWEPEPITIKVEESVDLADDDLVGAVSKDSAAIADVDSAAAADSAHTRDSGPDGMVDSLAEMYEEIRAELDPYPFEVAKDIEVHQSGYGAIFSDRMKMYPSQTLGSLFYLLFGIGGIMLIGMALFKTGVLTGDRSRGFYRRLAIIGYAVGIPLGILGSSLLVRQEFAIPHRFTVEAVIHALATAGMVSGHLGLIVTLQQSGLLVSLQARLRAVGRMAFTNYLTQTILCTTLFYGYGFGLYGRLDRPALLIVVGLLWIAQLLWSPFWMRRFRYGPAEWLWRSLTYKARQPMRR